MDIHAVLQCAPYRIGPVIKEPNCKLPSNPLVSSRKSASGTRALAEKTPARTMLIVAGGENPGITEGGTAPNVVPDRKVADFYIRYPDAIYLQQVREFVDAARAAALSTGTKVKIDNYRQNRDGISVATAGGGWLCLYEDVWREADQRGRASRRTMRRLEACRGIFRGSNSAHIHRTPPTTPTKSRRMR